MSNQFKRILDKHGVCVDCEEMYSHNLTEPFASCDCKTSEWCGELTPYMELEAQKFKTKKAITDMYQEWKDSYQGYQEGYAQALRELAKKIGLDIEEMTKSDYDKEIRKT